MIRAYGWHDDHTHHHRVGVQSAATAVETADNVGAVVVVVGAAAGNRKYDGSTDRSNR